MPDTDTVDYRQTATRDLLGALARHEPLALAEAYHRSAAAAHAVAARLLDTSRDVEGLLREVYADLWREPPADAPLEAWVRHRTFSRGRDRLRDSGGPAASPSAALLLRDSEQREPHDRAEAAIAALDDEALRALLLAHDRGTPTADQRDPDANTALRRALLALAEAEDRPDCREPAIGDYVLGLLDDDATGRVTAAIASSPDCAEVARALRRGRRRIEGLPPPPDVGQRVIAHVLATGGAVATAAPAPPERTDDDAGQARDAAPAVAAPPEPTQEDAGEIQDAAPTDLATGSVPGDQGSSPADAAAVSPPPAAAEVQESAEPAREPTGHPSQADHPGAAEPGQPPDPATSRLVPDSPDAGADAPPARQGDPSDATVAAASAWAARGDDEPRSALDDVIDDLPRRESGGDVRLSDLLGGHEGPEGSADAEDVLDYHDQGHAPAPDAPTEAFDVVHDADDDDGAPGERTPPRDPIRIGGGGARSEPPPEPAQDEWEGWAPPDDREEVSFGELSMDDSYPPPPSRGRRVGTVVLAIVGALLLLAAGGVAGLLLIRVLLG